MLLHTTAGQDGQLGDRVLSFTAPTPDSSPLLPHAQYWRPSNVYIILLVFGWGAVIQKDRNDKCDHELHTLSGISPGSIDGFKADEFMVKVV